MRTSYLLKDYQKRGINIYQETAIKDLIAENKRLKQGFDEAINTINRVKSDAFYHGVLAGMVLVAVGLGVVSVLFYLIGY